MKPTTVELKKAKQLANDHTRRRLSDWEGMIPADQYAAEVKKLDNGDPSSDLSAVRNFQAQVAQLLSDLKEGQIRLEDFAEALDALSAEYGDPDAQARISSRTALANWHKQNGPTIQRLCNQEAQRIALANQARRKSVHAKARRLKAEGFALANRESQRVVSLTAEERERILDRQRQTLALSCQRNPGPAIVEVRPAKPGEVFPPVTLSLKEYVEISRRNGRPVEGFAF